MRSYFYIFFIILFSSFVSSESVDAEFSKDIYLTGDTVQVDIQLDDVDELNTNMINLYYNGSEIQILPYLVELSFSNYYLYFDLPQSGLEGIYALEIDTLYSSIYHFEFNVTEWSGPEFSFNFNPGIIFSDNLQENNFFEVFISNPSDLEYNLAIHSDSQFIDISSGGMISEDYDYIPMQEGSSDVFSVYLSESLYEGQVEYIYLTVMYLDGSSSGTESMYTIPVYVDDGYVYGEDSLGESQGLVFVEDMDYFEINISYDESREGGYVRFKNFFNVPVNDVYFYVGQGLEGIIDLEMNTIDLVSPDEIVKLHFNINKNKDAQPGIYEGYISLVSESIVDNYYIVVNVYSTNIDSDLNGNNQTLEDLDVGGNIFVEGTPQTEQDVEQDEKVFNIWIWGVIFLIILVILLYLKYLKSKPKSSGFPFL